MPDIRYPNKYFPYVNTNNPILRTYFGINREELELAKTSDASIITAKMSKWLSALIVAELTDIKLYLQTLPAKVLWKGFPTGSELYRGYSPIKQDREIPGVTECWKALQGIGSHPISKEQWLTYWQLIVNDALNSSTVSDFTEVFERYTKARNTPNLNMEVSSLMYRFKGISNLSLKAIEKHLDEIETQIHIRSFEAVLDTMKQLQNGVMFMVAPVCSCTVASILIDVYDKEKANLS